MSDTFRGAPTINTEAFQADLDSIDAELLPVEVAVTAITMAELAVGPQGTGARGIDLLIAAIACSEQLPLYTRNPDDFKSLDDLVTIHRI